MHVLVVYGSKRGGTAGLAQMVADALVARGWTADVHPAAEVSSIAGYDGVVVGGSLYFGRWHHDAVEFVQRNIDTLRQLPVWFFSSGPIDDSARAGGIAAVPQVAVLAREVEIKGHMTFGGRLEPGTGGLWSALFARQKSGDYRDVEHVREWVYMICTHDVQAAEVLQGLPVQRAAASEPAARSTAGR